MAEQFYVDIFRHSDRERVHRIGPYVTERWAYQAMRGVEINLNHREFFADITPSLSSTAQSGETK